MKTYKTWMAVTVALIALCTGQAWGTATQKAYTWNGGAGDRVAFTLPAAFRMTQYPGEDVQHGGGRRFALEYGPILMAVVGPITLKSCENHTVILKMKPEDLIGKLQPIIARPLHFRIAGRPGHEVMPYWQIDYETFSAVPIFRE